VTPRGLVHRNSKLAAKTVYAEKKITKEGGREWPAKRVFRPHVYSQTERNQEGGGQCGGVCSWGDGLVRLVDFVEEKAAGTV